MPGQPDVWNHVPFPTLRRARSRVLTLLSRPTHRDRDVATAHQDSDPGPDGSPTPSPHDGRPRGGRRRVVRVAALVAALAVVAGGGVAAERAHKVVTLDVDGQVVQVTSFAGSVSGLLDAHDVHLRERDLVAPDLTAPLRDGSEVVVRHAREVVVLADGVESRIWTTALSAAEALETLAVRGQEVLLVASRSAATGRADLPVDLSGPVDVVVDGTVRHVEDGAAGLDAVLADLDVTIGDLDRVHAERTAPDATAPDGTALTAPVAVVVQRVVAQEESTATPVPFETVTEQTSALYRGQSRTTVAGAEGERTTVHRVILVDGVEESRMLLSDKVTTAPVTRVVQEGTKARPAPSPSGSGSTVGGDVWAALAQCESGGNPRAVSASGTYHGLYQFSVSTWRGVGGSGLPSEASAEEQTQRAQALQARSGWGQWPACSKKLGLR